MSLWVQRTSIGGGTLVHYSSQADGTGWCIAPMGFSSAGNIVATVYKPDNHVTGPVLSVNTWTHIATTYSQKNGLTLYVNGASVGSTGAQPNDASGAVVILTLGNSLSGSSGCGFQSITPGTFSGYLDEFRVYSRELSATEVFALFVDKTCTDGLMNGDETDIDCGGSCFKCTVGQNCTLPKDCNNVQCINDICAIPTCTDGIKNQDEADVDCGGSTCTKRCSLEQGCLSNTDCTTDNCDTTAKKCSEVWIKIASDSFTGDSNCGGIGHNPSISLNSCQSICMDMLDCTAIDYNPGTRACTYRQCATYPPKYQSQSGWEVWMTTRKTLTITERKETFKLYYLVACASLCYSGLAYDGNNTCGQMCYTTPIGPFGSASGSVGSTGTCTTNSTFCPGGIYAITRNTYSPINFDCAAPIHCGSYGCCTKIGSPSDPAIYCISCHS
ncbi:unnamed protein product [Adineta steineri]|uniref:LamG-like jellyroll fold domain-containing protein n=2 Tax=Adineta steineri TaxID=433720 RepID=A0A814T0N4_9BILA|nr:unnamed protein product [Adineta steineri]